MSNVSLQQLTNQELLEEFKAGVTATLRSWSAFRTAVNSGWGGPQSLEKAEFLRQSICDLLNGKHYPPKIDISELEDNLAIYMEEEFSVTLEDDSEKQVAEALLRMYDDCFGRGDPTSCRQIVQIATQAEEQIAQYPVQVQSTEHDDDEDDTMEDPISDESVTPLANSGSLARNYASEVLFGNNQSINKGTSGEEPPRQLGETPAVKATIPVDEDGFAPIVTKKKKKPPAIPM